MRRVVSMDSHFLDDRNRTAKSFIEQCRVALIYMRLRQHQRQRRQPTLCRSIRTLCVCMHALTEARSTSPRRRVRCTCGWATGGLQHMADPRSNRCAIACPCCRHVHVAGMSHVDVAIPGLAHRCTSVPGRRTHESTAGHKGNSSGRWGGRQAPYASYSSHKLRL